MHTYLLDYGMNKSYGGGEVILEYKRIAPAIPWYFVQKYKKKEVSACFTLIPCESKLKRKYLTNFSKSLKHKTKEN